MSDAADIIAKLQLEPHPEGGWFRETWRAEAGDGERAGGTAIHFLLEKDRRSHWHKVDATEIWLWHAGNPLALSVAASGKDSPETLTLGPGILAGERVQHVIPAGHWQAAVADRGWALLSCIVVPGFEFAGFELAPEGWAPST